MSLGKWDRERSGTRGHKFLFLSKKNSLGNLFYIETYITQYTVNKV